MTLTEQIGVYASFIAVILTLLRIISGITGSKTIKDSILLCAVFSALALFGAGSAKLFSSFPWFSDLISQNYKVANYISLSWQFLWAISIAYLFGLGVLWRLYVRSTRFKDWGTFKNLRELFFVKWYKERQRKKAGDKKGYEVNPPANSHHQETIEIFCRYLDPTMKYRRPVLKSGPSPWHIRDAMVNMMLELAEKTEEEFNYICCTVSPFNILDLIEKTCTDAALKNRLKKRLVFVDAYTETFGFEDEILIDRINSMRTEKMIQVVSCSSSAGVHKGTTDAFKILKKNAQGSQQERGACTIIYDTLSALAITETEAEVSEFIIHLSAAEHTYDMQTIFIEPDIENRKSQSIDTIRTCCGSPVLIEQEKT